MSVAVLYRISLTCASVSLGYSAYRRAATPATTGLENEVPDTVEYALVPVCEMLVSPVPGAEMSQVDP